MNATVKSNEMLNSEFLATVLETFPYDEAFKRDSPRMLDKIQRCAPGVAFPPAEEWRALMKRAIEAAFRIDDITGFVIDVQFGNGRISPRTQAFVGNRACDILLADRQQVVAA